MCSVDTSDLLQELWIKYIKCSYKNKCENLLAFLRSVYYNSIKRRNQFESILFSNDASGMMKLLIRELLNDLESVWIDNDDTDKGENDFKHLREYLESERGSLILYGIDAMLEQIVSVKENKVESVRSTVIKIITDAELGNILATTLMSVLNVLSDCGFTDDAVDEMLDLPDSTMSIHFHDQLHRSSVTKKPKSHRPSLAQTDQHKNASSDENEPSKPVRKPRKKFKSPFDVKESKVYVFMPQSGTEVGILSMDEAAVREAPANVPPEEDRLHCGHIVTTLRIVTRLLGHMILFDSSLCTNAISVNLEVFSTCCRLLRDGDPTTNYTTRQLVKLTEEVLYNIGITMKIIFVERDNCQTSVTMLLGHKVIDRLLLAYGSLSQRRAQYLPLVTDINKVIVCIFIIVARKILATGSYVFRGIIQLFTSWFINDGLTVALWALDEEMCNGDPQSLSKSLPVTFEKTSRATLFSQLCVLLHLLDQFPMEMGINDLDNKNRRIFSHHSDKFNLVLTANRKETSETCCYAMICELLLNNFINLLSKDCTSTITNTVKKRLYIKILNYIKHVRFCCSIDISSYSKKLLDLLVHQNSATVRAVIMRLLQILTRVSFEFYKWQDSCTCQYTSRHDIRLILKDIRNACLPIPRVSSCSRERYTTTPSDLFHFFDWLARGHDDKMNSLVVDIVVHPILKGLQTNVSNSLSQNYQLIGTAVLCLMPYLNSQWELEDLELIGTVCKKNFILQSTYYTCLTIVLLSKKPDSSFIDKEAGIKTRIIKYLLSNTFFESFLQSFNSDNFDPDQFMHSLFEDIHVWHCYRLLFSYNEEFRRSMFDQAGIDCCYLILKKIVHFISKMDVESVGDTEISVFRLFEDLLCLVVDGNMLKSHSYYEGFSCDVMLVQLQNAILNHFPKKPLVSKLLLSSIFKCCFRQKWTLQDGLYQLRRLFLDSIMNMSTYSCESDVDSDIGDYDPRSSSSQHNSTMSNVDSVYEADVSSGLSTFDESPFLVIKSKEILQQSLQKLPIFMKFNALDKTTNHLEINVTLVELLLNLILKSQVEENDVIYQETLESIYSIIRTLPGRNQRLFILDPFVEKMSVHISNILIGSQRSGLQIILLKLLILPGSSWCTSMRLRFLIEISIKNRKITKHILQMLVKKAALIQTFEPEISIKFPIDKTAIVATDLPFIESSFDKETYFDYLVNSQLTDCQWRSLDPEHSSGNAGFSVSMWLQMDVISYSTDRVKNPDFRKNKKKLTKQTTGSKKLASVHEARGLDSSDNEDLIHLVSLYSRDRVTCNKTMSIQVWCKPLFGTVVIRLYERRENDYADTQSISLKGKPKSGLGSPLWDLFKPSSSNSSNDTEPPVTSDQQWCNSFSLVDESIIHGFVTTNSWNFLTVTVKWRLQESAIVTWLLNGDVSRQTKLHRNGPRIIRGSNSLESYVAIGHISRSTPKIHKQNFNLGSIFLFENPIITCGNDNLSLMLMTPNWDGGQVFLSSHHKDNRKTLATVVMRLLVDRQPTTESAALLLERGQNILSNGWLAKISGYIATNLVGTYTSEDLWRFNINGSYNNGSSFISQNDHMARLSEERRQPEKYDNVFIIIKTTLDSALENLGGISVFAFWMATLVEQGDEESSLLILRLFLLLLRRSISLSYQNMKDSGYSILFQLFKSFKMNLNSDIITEVLNHAIFESSVKLKIPDTSDSPSKLCRDPTLLRELLLQWKMWATSKLSANEDVSKLDMGQSMQMDKQILSQINNLLNEDNIYSNINCGSLGFADISYPLLLACQEPFDILPVPLPSEICKLIIQIITNFIPTPADLSTVTKLCNAILHLYQISMKDTEVESGKYFRHIRPFSSDWEKVDNGHCSTSSSHSPTPGDKLVTPEEISHEPVTSNSNALTSLETSQISEVEIETMRKFYGATLSQRFSTLGDNISQPKELEKSGDSNSSESSVTLTMINDDDEPTAIDKSLESTYLSSGIIEATIMEKPNFQNISSSSRIDTLAGLISTLENVIQVKISDTILDQLSMQNFCFEFIIHLLTHPSPVVRHRGLSLFRVYIFQKPAVAKATSQCSHMLKIVAYVIHQNCTTTEIVAETVSIIFGQNITDLIVAIDWKDASADLEDLTNGVDMPPVNVLNHLPQVDPRSRLSGIVSLVAEPSKTHNTFEEVINQTGNHFGLPFRQSCVLLLSTLENIQSSSIVSMLRFCDWLFILNPILLQASVKAGLLGCICNMCHHFSMTSIGHEDGAFQALLSVCITVAINVTALSNNQNFQKLLETCEFIYLAGHKWAKRIHDKGDCKDVVLEQYVVRTIISTILETICILNYSDPVFKITPHDDRLQRIIRRLPKNYANNHTSLSLKLIKTIGSSTNMVINTQENFFNTFNELLESLGLKLVDFIAKVISNCLSCNVIPDHFSVYLSVKETIKSNLGDLIIFLSNPKLDISLRLDLLRRLFKFDNVHRVTRYSLLGNSSGSMCLILNLKHIMQDLKSSEGFDSGIVCSISNLLQVISLDFDVEIIKDDNRNLWIHDCSQKLRSWTQNINEAVVQWNANADRGHSELLVSLKKCQNSYRPFARKNLQEQYIANIKAQRSSEFYRRRTWKTLISNFTQDRAIWCNDHSGTSFMQLDPTEGPCRIRRRMVKTTPNLNRKFFTTDRNYVDDYSSNRILAFLFDSTYSADKMVFESPIKYQLLKCIENVQHACPCVWVSQSGTFDGEFFVGRSRLGFLVDNVNDNRNLYDQLPNPLKDYGFISWKLNEINWVLKRRFKLRDLALEVFMKDGRNCLIATKTTQERDAIASSIESFLPPTANIRPRLIEIQNQWLTGEMTNFDYLTILNTAAGRSYNDIMQYPVFPFILTNYSSYILNLEEDSSFRDFSNPITVQKPAMREKVEQSFAEKADEYQRQQRINDDLENMPIWAVPPHHYSSLYSNSATVLYYMIRVPPFTQKFIEFQDNQFDRPDRMFHTLESAWELSTSSVSCVKEIIPEFFYLPEMFTNDQSFDFGVRSNGLMVDDVVLPKWCNGDARIFCLVHRVALESQRVSAKVNLWIDLIFGFKQTGKAALESLNLFHPYTYFKAISPDEIVEPIRRKAVEQMIENYGQIPKQLFLNRPHSSKKLNYTSNKKVKMSEASSMVSLERLTSESDDGSDSQFVHKERTSLQVLPNVIGISWGDWIGSPQNRQTFMNTVSSASYPGARSFYLLPKSKYSKKTHKVLVLPQCSAVLYLLAVDDDVLPMMRFSTTNLRKRVSITSMTLCHSHNSEYAAESHGSFYVSLGSGKSKVTSMAVYQRSGRIFFGMESGLIEVYQGDVNVYSYIAPFLENFSKHWKTLIGHSSSVTHMIVGESFAVLASCDQRANVAIWDPQRLDLMHYIDWTLVRSTSNSERLLHSDNDTNGLPTSLPTTAMSAMCFSETLGDLVISRVISKTVSNSQRMSMVSLFTINGKHVRSIFLPGTVISMSYTNLPEGRHVNAIAVASSEGHLAILSSWNLQIVWKTKIPLKSGLDPISCVQYTHSGKELYVLHSSGLVNVIQSSRSNSNFRQSAHFWL